MLIKMKSNQKGSQNGIIVQSFEKGKTYDVVESLAKVFLVNEMAEAVSEKEDKDAGVAPKNKDAGVAPKKKKEGDE